MTGDDWSTSRSGHSTDRVIGTLNGWRASIGGRIARQASFVIDSVTYPSGFQLPASLNPCPCGWLGDASGRCHCTEERVDRYRPRISGPLIDRIDLHVEVPPIDPGHFHDDAIAPGESSETVRGRVMWARERQLARASISSSPGGPRSTAPPGTASAPFLLCVT